MPVVSTNLAANTACRLVNINASDQSSSVSKLASSSRIVKASDDAAGSAISTGIKADVAVLEQAANNASHALAILQMADGAAGNIADILMRMKALAAQSASATVTNTERAYTDAEYQNLREQITFISHNTLYLNQRLLCTTATWGPVMVGSEAADTIMLSPIAAYLCEYGLNISGTTVITQSDALTALSQLDHALSDAAEGRAALGAQMSQFEAQANSIATSIEGLSAANSSIEDLDVAAEQAKLSSIEVKLQSGVAALASANQMPKSLLKLFE